MQRLLREYLDEWKRKQKRQRKTAIAVVLAAIMLVGGVIWNLTQYGIAMTGEPKCGMEEHTHSDSCYADVLTCGREESEGHTHTDACYQTVSELVCGQEESEEHTHSEACYQTVSELICGQEESEGHTHTDACYEKQLSCGKEEHTHSEACYIDKTADVEDASVWNAQYADTEWKDAWGEDLVIAARKQIDYKESADNYSVAEDGSHKGYTRYGQFAGDVYADWDAAFVNFCMHYAGLEDTGLFPKETETAKWYDKFVKGNAGKNAEFLTDAKDYEPQTGDIVFFEKKDEETENQMGVVSSYNKEQNEIKVIEGNVDNTVKENKYAAGDKYITKYLKLSEMEEAYKNGTTETLPEETEEQLVEAAEENTEEAAAPEDAELNYEDDQITVKVTAEEAGSIPEGASLKVIPVVTDDPETAEQYRDVETKLQEKAEGEKYEIAGFLAYDISFVDGDGNKLEPNGKVNVSMDYKKATIAEEAVNAVAKAENLESTKDLDVTVMHLEENVDGTVKEVVDMVADETQKAEVSSTEAMEVKKAEFVTDGFSIFAVTWVDKDRKPELKICIVDDQGNSIGTDNSYKWDGSGIVVTELASKCQVPENFYFLKALVGDQFESAKEIYRLRYSETNECFQYKVDPKGDNINFEKSTKVWFVYKESDQNKPGSDESKLEEVPHRKYIDYLGDGGVNRDTTLKGDDYYRLYLDVTGIPSVAPKSADIVLILDYSSSMGGHFGNGTRWDAVKKSARLAVNTLISDKTQNRMSIIWFDQSAQIFNGVGNPFTDNKAALLKEIDDKNYDYGTNYQAAFMAAQDVLKKSNNGNKKFVIFVTDGDPYGYCMNGSNYTEDGCYGGDMASGKSYAISQARQFTNLNGFYAVAVKEGAEFLSQGIIEAVSPGATTAESFTANDETGMQSAFETIVGSVTKQIGNVTIEDTIEEYMSFVYKNGEAIQDVQSGDEKSELISSLGLKIHIHDSGESNGGIAGAEEYKGEYTWKIDPTSRTISVNFGKEYFLERNKIYTLSFNVKVNESASNLPHSGTGDENTDYPFNNTSSERQGLYSNEKATVTYSRMENGEYKPEEKPYAHPVVQTRMRLDLKKFGSDYKVLLEGAEFNLCKKKGVSWEPQKSVAVDSKGNPELYLDSGDYKLQETQAPSGFSLLEEPIYFRVDCNNKNIKLINAAGKELPVTEMWKMEEESVNGGTKIFVLSIKNTALYSLPSTGGPGVYWYIFSGVLLMAGAMLIIYKNKCKEVLKS